MKARQARFAGTVASTSQAEGYLMQPGDFVLVKRARLRNFVMLCPDGCGERIIINLDPRTGPAWRYYHQCKNQITLFPSVWRDSGCQSHFIIWRDTIYWMDADDRTTYTAPVELEARVLESLSAQPVHFATIAERLGEVPWDVLEAARALTARSRAVEGTGKMLGHFKLR